MIIDFFRRRRRWLGAGRVEPVPVKTPPLGRRDLRLAIIIVLALGVLYLIGEVI